MKTDETVSSPADLTTESPSATEQDALKDVSSTPAEEVSTELGSQSEQEGLIDVFLTPEAALTDYYSSPKSRKLQLLPNDDIGGGKEVEGENQQISGRRFSNSDVNAAILINLMGSQFKKEASLGGEESRISLSKTFSSSKKSTAQEVSSKETFDKGEVSSQNLAALGIAKGKGTSPPVLSKDIPIFQREPSRGGIQGSKRASKGLKAGTLRKPSPGGKLTRSQGPSKPVKIEAGNGQQREYRGGEFEKF